MQWEVAFGDEFDEEFEELPEAVQDELLASAKLLATFGPQLSRPHADTPATRSTSTGRRISSGT